MESYARRPATWDDLGAVAVLIADADRVDYGTPTFTQYDLDAFWRRARFDLARDAWVFETAEGALAGYAYVWLRDESSGEVVLLGVVHPAHRGRGLGTRIAASMEERAAELIAGLAGSDPVLTTVVPVGDDPAVALFEKRGYAIVRRFWMMVIDLASEPMAAPDPPDIVIEQVQPDLNAAKIHAVMADAFTDHWRHVDEPYEEWRANNVGRSGMPLWFVAYADGGAAGALVGWVEGNAGYVGQVGVRSPFRRRGVARALLLRAFAAFREAGATTADLSVDSENPTGATTLYERVGMRAAASWLFLQKKV